MKLFRMMEIGIGLGKGILFFFLLLLCFKAGFVMFQPVLALKSSTNQLPSVLDLVRKDMVKKVEPNMPAKSIDSAKTQQEEMPKGEFILHFPKGRSIGQLSIQDEGPVGEIQSFFSWTEGDRDWESFALAKGDMIVPPSKRVALSISKADTSSLSALSKLNPDDLYRLAISGSSPSDPITRPELNDRCLPYISRMTGLKDLQLFQPDISTKGFGSLTSLKSLEYLTLSGNINDEALAAISQLKSLKGLYISENRLTNKGMSYLAGFALLEELMIGGGRLTDDGLAHLAKLPSLKYLMLSGENFSDAGMAYLKDIPKLRILHVGSLKNLTDVALVNIAKIPNLEALSLHWSENITDDGIIALTELKSLKKLDIGSSKVTDKGLSYLRNLTNLDYLSLPPRGISDTGLTYIGQLSNLRHLDVSRVHYVDSKMDSGYYTDKGVAELAKCKLLEELTIGSIGMNDEAMSDIAKLTNLKRLFLFGCSNVTNKGLEKLATLKSLQTLSITETNITIGGLSSLNKLTNLTNLTLYDIRQDNVGLNLSKLSNLVDLILTTKRKRIGTEIVYDKLHNSDLTCLAKLNKLKRLQLPGFGLDDNGLKYFSGLTNLEFLNIYCAGESSITDEGIKQLAGLPKLNRLMIKDGHFTDKSLEYLSGMPSLSWLELTSDFAFSNKAIKNFQAKNTNVERLQLMP